MRILAAIVIPPHLIVSGAVSAALSLSEAIAETIEIDVALMSDCEESSTLGRARLMRRRAINPFGWTRGLLPDRFRTLFWRSDISQLIQNGTYDLVHLHNPIPALELRRIARACREMKIPYVISTHGFVEIASGGTAYGISGLKRLAWNRYVKTPFEEVVDHAARVLALSPEETPILHRLNVEDERIGLVTNGVDLSPFDDITDKEMTSLRRRFELTEHFNPDIPVCVFLGNHTFNKGIDILLDAFVAQELPFVLIVGGMMKPHNLRYDDYKRFADPENRQRIVFTDYLDDVEARTLMRIADLFVFPTRADTLPLVILEAMASSTPVLATRVGGIPYQIDEHCGQLVVPGDPHAFAAGYRDLYDRRLNFSEMGVAARRVVETKFNWIHSANSAIRVYRDLLTIES